MHFHSHAERNAVCAALVGIAGHEHLWNGTGPSTHGIGIRESGAVTLPPAERTMVLFAFALWEGESQLSLSALQHLCPRDLFAIGSLLISLAYDCSHPPGVERHAVASWVRIKDMLGSGTWREIGREHAADRTEAKLVLLGKRYGTTAEALAAQYLCDGSAPGICMNPRCDFTAEYEPDTQSGFCEACGTQSVWSIHVLLGML